MSSTSTGASPRHTRGEPRGEEEGSAESVVTPGAAPQLPPHVFRRSPRKGTRCTRRGGSASVCWSQRSPSSATVAASAAFTATGASASGKTFYFIPKDTLNPYEVIADKGGKHRADGARQQAGGRSPARRTRRRRSSRRSRRRSSRTPPASSSRRTTRRPSARRSTQAMEGGHQGRRVRLGRELPPALHQPGGHRDDRSQPDAAARPADGLQGRVGDPLGRLDRHEPERLDQVHEARAEEGEVQEHEVRRRSTTATTTRRRRSSRRSRCSRRTRT